MSSKKTIRCYAQLNIFNNYIPHVEKLLSDAESDFHILPSVQVGSYFAFDIASCKSSDYSILVMKEKWATRESQKSWFLRMTKKIVDNVKEKILIVIFSNLSEEIENERKVIYESKIPHATIVYIDLEDWSAKDSKELDDIIKNFVENLK